jgi:hypothetical protein
MAQTCSICKHPRRQEIERAMVGKVSCRKIAALYDFSASTVSAHRRHLPEALLGAGRDAKSQEDSELAKATNKLLAQMQTLERRVRHGRNRNTAQAGDLLLKISREIRALLELRARFTSPRVSSSPAQMQANPSQESDEAEISVEEADAIAEKWLKRRSDSTAVTTPSPRSDSGS